MVKPLKKVSTSSSLLDDSNDDPELVIGVDEHYDDKGEIFEANDSGCDSVNEKLLRKDGKVEKQHRERKFLGAGGTLPASFHKAMNSGNVVIGL